VLPCGWLSGRACRGNYDVLRLSWRALLTYKTAHKLLLRLRLFTFYAVDYSHTVISTNSDQQFHICNALATQSQQRIRLLTRSLKIFRVEFKREKPDAWSHRLLVTVRQGSKRRQAVHIAPNHSNTSTSRINTAPNVVTQLLIPTELRFCIIYSQPNTKWQPPK
jgi:hypothetical protein